jgi:hypothetical protein
VRLAILLSITLHLAWIRMRCHKGGYMQGSLSGDASFVNNNHPRTRETRFPEYSKPLTLLIVQIGTLSGSGINRLLLIRYVTTARYRLLEPRLSRPDVPWSSTERLSWLVLLMDRPPVLNKYVTVAKFAR